MPFPTQWPPQPASGNRSIRFFASVTATTVYADNAYIFSQQTGANTYTTIPTIQRGDTTTVVNLGYMSPGGSATSIVCANTIQITNDGAVDVSVSFDGTNLHGIVKAGETICWRERREAGIAVKTTAGTAAVRIESW